MTVIRTLDLGDYSLTVHETGDITLREHWHPDQIESVTMDGDSAVAFANKILELDQEGMLNHYLKGK